MKKIQSISLSSFKSYECANTICNFWYVITLLSYRIVQKLSVKDCFVCNSATRNSQLYAFWTKRVERAIALNRALLEQVCATDIIKYRLYSFQSPLSHRRHKYHRPQTITALNDYAKAQPHTGVSYTQNWATSRPPDAHFLTDSHTKIIPLKIANKIIIKN